MYDAFEADYLAMYGETPPSPVFNALAVDAANMIMNAIDEIGRDDAGTLSFGRYGLRKALFATSGAAWIAGTITCCEFGDCWTRPMDVWLVSSGDFASP